MKRAAQEREQTLRVWRCHLSWHGKDAVLCSCELQPGRFRKGQRVWGCGKSRCYLCHGEKLLKRPTHRQRLSDISFHEWRYEYITGHWPIKAAEEGPVASLPAS
jgi:hypothetical protein